MLICEGQWVDSIMVIKVAVVIYRCHLTQSPYLVRLTSRSNRGFESTYRPTLNKDGNIILGAFHPIFCQRLTNHLAD